MEPAWIQFESAHKSKVNLTFINVDEKTTPEFKRFSKVNTQPTIPVTYWLDRRGKILSQKVGQMSLAELSSSTKAAMSKAR